MNEPQAITVAELVKMLLDMPQGLPVYSMNDQRYMPVYGGPVLDTTDDGVECVLV